jgi:lysosomal Pro-X carboxypeptidase
LDPWCADPDGAFGFPDHPDPWSNWLDLQYGNARVLDDGTTSNIVFSNGLLDPWSAAGVFLDTMNGTKSHRIMPGLTLQKNPNGLAALLLDHGGHHSDLMFSDPINDPPAFAAARKIEALYIQSWIDQFWENAATNEMKLNRKKAE